MPDWQSNQATKKLYSQQNTLAEEDHENIPTTASVTLGKR